MKNNFKKLVFKCLSWLFEKIDPSGYISSSQLDYVYHDELKHLTLVSVRSILNFTTLHNKNQRSDLNLIEFNLDLINKSDKQLSIFINSDAVENFCKRIIPYIKMPFILFIGNSDLRFDNLMKESNSVQLILENPLLIKVYIQNLGFIHQKAKMLPIGIDFNTLWEKPRKNGFGKRISPLLHQKIIFDILRNTINLYDRKNLVYCNWHFQMHRGDRKECFEQINKELCFFEKLPIDRFSNYRTIANFRFVLCPSGLGWDSYRIWETIILGSIPILKENEFTINLRNLPCIIIKQWSDLTFDLLNQEFDRIIKSQFDFSLISNDYWLNIVNTRSSNSNFINMTYSEFQANLKKSFYF